MHKTILLDEPEDRTTCLTCGETIIYFRYIGPDKQLRSVPRYHNGRCKALAKINNAEKKLKRYKRRG